MDGQTTILIGGAAVVLTAITSLFWFRELGRTRGVLAFLFRLGWLCGLLTILFPQVMSNQVHSNPKVGSVHLVVDDSNSMKEGGDLAGSLLDQTESFVQHVEGACAERGCKVRVHKLSDAYPVESSGKTPLIDYFSSFLDASSGDPWMIFTDGGDQDPARNLKYNLSKVGPGLIFGLGIEDAPNLWIEQMSVPNFGFQGKPNSMDVLVKRSESSLSERYVQVQVKIDEEIVASEDVFFGQGETQVLVGLTIPATSKGFHLISAKVLAIKGEQLFWDNEAFAQMEVVANTIGVLHLSGSPTPDARYMRRFLKSEPKFDIVSFFILRDPWDSQFVNEREMSLIPFPAERLFTEELKNFKLLVIQNFRMAQFLNQRYQDNLVEFVKNGGGLLFIGGRRAFNKADLAVGKLSEILPFKVEKAGVADAGLSFMRRRSTNQTVKDDTYPWYDESFKYSLRMADPSSLQRELATVYDDFRDIFTELAKVDDFYGYNRADNMDFKNDAHTPILEAVSEGESYPLISASYPNKGRALWVYTGGLWKMAQTPSVSRDLYNEFLSSSIRWLIRDDIRKPLAVENFRVRVADGATEFDLNLVGPALRYFRGLGSVESEQGKWSVSVCGRALQNSSYSPVRTSAQELRLGGRFEGVELDGKTCSLKVEASDKSFGQETVEAKTHIYRTYTDAELPYSATLLQKLSQATKAELEINSSLGEAKRAMNGFLDKHFTNDGLRPSPKEVTSEEPFWFFGSIWAYLAFLCLPGEVLVRRWKYLFG